MLIRPKSVRALTDYRIHLEFSDGEKGEVDLSHLAGKGVFEAWNDYGFFKTNSSLKVVFSDILELIVDVAVSLRLEGKAQLH